VLASMILIPAVKHYVDHKSVYSNNQEKKYILSENRQGQEKIPLQKPNRSA